MLVNNSMAHNVGQQSYENGSQTKLHQHFMLGHLWIIRTVHLNLRA